MTILVMTIWPTEIPSMMARVGRHVRLGALVVWKGMV